MFDLFRWLDEVNKRRKEQEGQEAFRDWYLRKLNNQDEAVIARVREKIATTRRFYKENPHLEEKPTCIHIRKGHK